MSTFSWILPSNAIVVWKQVFEFALRSWHLVLGDPCRTDWWRVTLSIEHILRVAFIIRPVAILEHVLRGWLVTANVLLALKVIVFGGVLIEECLRQFICWMLLTHILTKIMWSEPFAKSSNLLRLSLEVFHRILIRRRISFFVLTVLFLHLYSFYKVGAKDGSFLILIDLNLNFLNLH